MRASVIKPGLLVSLKTSLTGGVDYQRVDLEADHKDERTGARIARWETARQINDPIEYEAATVCRSKARSLVASVCAHSAFGLLCPSDREDALQEAIREAQGLALEHNAGANLTFVEIYVLVGRVAQDDAEAARAIGSEVRELLEAMKSGIDAADPKRIREAADRARALGAMLSDDVSGKVTKAIEQARAAAREIVKRVEKGGEQAAEVLLDLSTSRIEAARFAVLDLDQEAPVTQEAPAAPQLDLGPATPDEPAGAIQALPAAIAAINLEL